MTLGANFVEEDKIMKNEVCWCGEAGYQPYASIRTHRFRKVGERQLAQIVSCARCGSVRMYDNGREGLPDYEASYLYEQLSPRHRWMTELVRRYASGDSILDIGCNTGILLEEIRRLSPSITRLKGVDIDGRAIAWGREKWGLDLEAVDAAEIRESFDAVILAHTLEHVQDLGTFYGLLDRLLKPGGKIFIAVPNIQALAARKAFLPWWPALQPDHHVWYFHRDALLRSFQEILPSYRYVYSGSFFIWRPRFIPAAIWKLFAGRKAAWEAERFWGDELELVMEKPRDLVNTSKNIDNRGKSPEDLQV